MKARICVHLEFKGKGLVPSSIKTSTTEGMSLLTMIEKRIPGHRENVNALMDPH